MPMFYSFTDIIQSVALSGSRSVKSFTIIPDDEMDKFAFNPDPDINLCSVCMPDDISQQFFECQIEITSQLQTQLLTRCYFFLNLKSDSIGFKQFRGI